SGRGGGRLLVVRALSHPFRFATARFFFQAEDGIRDRNVTGVQTCALPISVPRAARAVLCTGDGDQRDALLTIAFRRIEDRHLLRSEERRVGKECRSRGAP